MPLSLHFSGSPWQPNHDTYEERIHIVNDALDIIPHAIGTPDGYTFREVVFSPCDKLKKPFN